MGLNIKDIISRKEIEISDLKGKTLCVDAFNALYQFLSTIRQYDGTPLMDSHKNITSHLSGIFYRNIALLDEGIKLIYVFDGKAPDLKSKVHKKRQDVRDVAKEKYEEAKQSEDLGGMKRYSSQLVRLTDEMIVESKELLEAMGIAVVQAPGEGEAQAAYLARVDPNIYASVSQDYDSLLFGAPKLIRNLTLSRKKKTFSGYVEVFPEIIELDKVLNHLGINLDQLICIGILVGTDYNPKGVPGIGQKKALELVKKFEQPVLIFNELKERINSLPVEDQFDWKEIFELFHKPSVIEPENLICTDVNIIKKGSECIGGKIIFPRVNENKIKEILVERHEFSEERIDKQIEKLVGMKEKSKQKGLDKWF